MKYMYLLLISSLLAACGSKEYNYTADVQYKFVPIELPTNLVSRCLPPRPVSKEQYINMSINDRERELTRYVIILMGEVKKCDNKITGIKTYVDKYNTLYQEDTTKKVKENP